MPIPNIAETRCFARLVSTKFRPKKCAHRRDKRRAAVRLVELGLCLETIENRPSMLNTLALKLASSREF